MNALYGLSPEQAEVMIGPSNMLVTACPGAGKTRSVAARAAWLRSTGKRFALLSHTNVGAFEISAATMREHAVRVTPESFVGTLHSFLGKYVLTPFGHHVTGSTGAVRMDPEAVRERQPDGLNSLAYRFRATGEVCRIDNGYATATTLQSVKDFKVACAADGIVSYEDALYWAYIALQRNDLRVSHAIAKRFDEVLVDEAQDASRSQLACLKSLIAGGLKSLVLVGDFDQAIYTFAGAEPAACRKMAGEVGLSNQRLRQNYRSSQQLCNLTARFRRDSNVPDEAVGQAKSASIAPKIVFYPPGDPGSIPQLFANAMAQEDATFESKAILARSNGLVNGIQGTVGATTGTLPALTRLLLSIATSDAALSLDNMRSLERAMIALAFPEDPSSTRIRDGRLLRSAVGAFIATLPAPVGDAQLWLNATYAHLDATAKNYLRPDDAALVGPLHVPSIGTWSFEGSSKAHGDIRVGTIHSAKGESIDAVMVASEPATRSATTSRAAKWAAALTGSGVSNEEQRIFYVAATRAQRMLGLALPEDESEATVDAFLGAGFIVVTADQ